MGRLRKVKKKQILLYQGEATNQVFLIKEGVVKAFTSLQNGEDVIIAMFGPGDAFPLSFDVSKIPVSLFYYEAMSECLVERFYEEEFNFFRKNFPATTQEISKDYLSALLHINALVQPNAFEKLAHMLRYLALRFGAPLESNNFTRINIKLTQQDIASICNMSRETANIELSKLKKINAVVEKAKFYNVNLSALNKVIDDEIDPKNLKF